jgi:hypothetical protein
MKKQRFNFTVFYLDLMLISILGLVLALPLLFTLLSIASVTLYLWLESRMGGQGR